MFPSHRTMNVSFACCRCLRTLLLPLFSRPNSFFFFIPLYASSTLLPTYCLLEPSLSVSHLSRSSLNIYQHIFPVSIFEFTASRFII
ncbi:hypothetical protein BDW74DRAFT_153350 [Aspergillus multicolor]|uniref:uncharacterized protein n=1 Tax=Aspergillus multicolor TaxID=41759 RepID=UPI003CCD60EA